MRLRMVVLQARRLRLQPAKPADRHWLCALLNRISAPRGIGISLTTDGPLVGRPRNREGAT